MREVCIGTTAVAAVVGTFLTIGVVTGMLWLIVGWLAASVFVTGVWVIASQVGWSPSLASAPALVTAEQHQPAA